MPYNFLVVMALPNSTLPNAGIVIYVSWALLMAAYSCNCFVKPTIKICY
mgnify:CR=1 FL=1